jgi:hypothetical protein
MIMVEDNDEYNDDNNNNKVLWTAVRWHIFNQFRISRYTECFIKT